MKKLQKFIVIFITLHSALGFSKVLDVLPIISNEIINDTITLQYRLPCGSTFQGIVAKPQLFNLSVGIAYLPSRTPCANLNPVESIQLDWMSPSVNLQIVPMLSTGGKLLWKTRKPHLISDLGNNKRGRAKIIYNSKCGLNPMLLIPSAVENKTLGILVIEKNTKKSVSSLCQFKEKSLVVENIFNDNIVKNLKSVETDTKDLGKSFVIKFVPTKAVPQQNDQRNTFKVKYQRACNQAPIGLVLSNPYNMKNNEQKIRAGMLVAYYYNYRCPEHLAKSSVENFEVSNIRFTKKTSIHYFREGQWDNTLNIRIPQVGKQNKKGLNLIYESGCGTQLGVIYTNDQFGKRSVGILESNKSNSCNQLLKKVSLYQPFYKNLNLAKSDKSAPLPLKVRGL